MPQHFQQMAGRYEGLVQYAASLASSFPWGLIRFDYDRSTLVSGILRVLRVEAVMRDGLFAEGGTDFGIPLELNLKNYADHIQSGYLTIHLVVPAQRAISTRGELARYESHDGGAVTDNTTGDEPVHIPRLRPRISLWAGEHPPARFESLPLLRVEVNNDTFQEYEYIPPLLTVTPDSALGVLCAETTSLVRAKSYVLADHLRGGHPGKADSDLFDLRVKVNALASGLPGPEAALQAGRIHPFALYLLFCQLAGHVGPITSALVCPQFPAYRHDDLLGTFHPVLEYIRAALAEAVVESWLALPFRHVNGRLEAGPSAALDRAISAGSGIDRPVLALALRVPTESTEGEVQSWGEDCVIGSAGVIAALLSNRVPGAGRRRIERLPGLVAPRGILLMALALDEETARPGEPLQIVERFTNKGRPTDAILYIQRAAADRTGG